MTLAVGLFAEGSVSLAKGAGLAQMTRYEFATYLSRIGLSAYGYTWSDYQEDLAFASSHQGA